jgi:diguanylate cyclase (GGDEF)-like protein
LLSTSQTLLPELFQHGRLCAKIAIERQLFVTEEGLLEDAMGAGRDCQLDAEESVALLLVEPDPRAAVWIGEMLRSAWDGDLLVAHVERLDGAANQVLGQAVSCALVDVSGLEGAWIEAVEQIQVGAPGVAIVLLFDEIDEQQALAGLRAGAQDCLAKPELCAALLRRAVKFAIEGKHSKTQLVHEALHDPLTGLPNRALFLDRLGLALDRSRRWADAITVLFLDVDNFKKVNDTFGHHAGDQLLVELGGRLKGILRPMDTVARYGGDEFTFLLEDLGDERDVAAIAQRISDSAGLPFRIKDAEVTITVSIGIATVSDPALEPGSVIQQADAAMYRAKQHGQARFELFDETSGQRAMERLELERALRRALDRRELVVYYQPQISLGERFAITGLEALVRWQHPVRGLIGARDFIPLAEEGGLIGAIGQYVLESALAQLTVWRRSRPDITLSVNLSYHQLEDTSLSSILSAAVRSTAVDPAALRLEIAEAALARCREPAITALEGLETSGFRLAIDDFGIGSLSLQTLKRLPIDTIKLDDSVLASATEERSVLGAAVGMGHALGLRVIAEGVETEQQVIELRALGCDEAQGFLFSQPVPEAEIEQLFAASYSPQGAHQPQRRRWWHLGGSGQQAYSPRTPSGVAYAERLRRLGL